MRELDTLSIKNLNFEDIKESFRNFLTQQNLFTDYNLEGSNFAILLDILAYNTYHTAIYQNFISAESWLDSAVQRSSVVSHTKLLGYLPTTKKCSKFVAQLEIPAKLGELSSSIIIPTYTAFVGGGYTFQTLDPVTLYKNEQNVFVSLEPVVLFEGKRVSYKFISDTRNLYTIPYDALDSDTVTVLVYDSLEYYEKVQQTGDYSRVHQFLPENTILNKDGSSEIYFLQESISGFYELYFGDGILGKSLEANSIIEVIFIAPSGPQANGIRSVEYKGTVQGTTSIQGYNYVQSNPITPTSISFGGKERQEIESIRKYAPFAHEAQNRIVTLNDYQYFISQYLGETDKITIWGGEDNFPPRYGSVFCMIKPKSQEFLSPLEKLALKNYIENKSVVGLEFNIIDPNLVYIIPQLKIRFSTSLNKDPTLFFNRVDSFLAMFSKYSMSTFRSSDLILYLKENVSGIRSITLRLNLMKATPAVVGSVYNYSVLFDTKILPGTLKVSSNFSLTTEEEVTELIYDSSGIVYYEKTDLNTLVTNKTIIGTIDYEIGKVLLNSLLVVSIEPDLVFNRSELIFTCSSLEDDFIGTKQTIPVFEVTNIQKEFINDPV